MFYSSKRRFWEYDESKCKAKTIKSAGTRRQDSSVEEGEGAEGEAISVGTNGTGFAAK